MNDTKLRQFGVRRKKKEKNFFLQIPTGGKLTRWLFIKSRKIEFSWDKTTIPSAYTYNSLTTRPTVP